MLAELAFVGARGTDSVTVLNAHTAKSLKDAGFDYAIQYLGGLTGEAARSITGAGLRLMVVTYADKFDGPAAAAQCKAIRLPPGVTVWLDVEGVTTLHPEQLMTRVNDWADAMTSEGYMAGLYVGAGCPLTSRELYDLAVVRYWHSLSRVVDRNGVLAEPDCGWCQYQLFPSCTRGGVWVDVDVIQEDFRNRLPAWCVA